MKVSVNGFKSQDSIDSNLWCLDSSTTPHLTKGKENFIKECDTNFELQLADNSSIKIEYKWIVFLTIKTNNKTNNFKAHIIRSRIKYQLNVS